MHIVIIAIIGFMFIFELWINILNVSHSRKEMPSSVKHIYDDESYQKWMSYHQEHLRFGIIKKTFSVVLTLSFFNFWLCLELLNLLRKK